MCTVHVIIAKIESHLKEEPRRNRNEYSRKYRNTLTGRTLRLLNSAKDRAKKKGEFFQLTKDRVLKAVEKGVCEQTGIPFALVLGMGRRPFGPSIDKINPEFPYSDYNAQVVCNVYQFAKNEFTDEDVLTMAKALVQNNGYEVRNQLENLL